jgi:hypothetical protein
MSIPWWGWVLIGLAGFFFLGFKARSSWRKGIRREFIDFLRAEAPELEVIGETKNELTLKVNGSEEVRAFLHNIYTMAGHLKIDDVEGRKKVFAQSLKAFRESQTVAQVDPERDRARLLPRLLPAGAAANMSRQAGGATLPAISSGIPGLEAVFVLDSENSVLYLDEDRMRQLDLNLEKTLLLAKENLRRLFPEEVVRRTLQEHSLSTVKSLDTFDAARILLVPEYLKEGERLAAVIPDRDTLVLMDVPQNGNWQPLRDLAKITDRDPLFQEPILVTQEGFTLPG